MNSKEFGILVLLIILGLIVFAAGAGIGIFYQSNKDSAQVRQAQEAAEKFKNLSSDIIVAVAAYGSVTKISGRDVTISYNGKELTINVPENVSVTSLTSGTGNKSAKFSNIKQGDNLNIALKVAEDGKMTAQTVLILSSGTVVPAK